jgi:hypothetical protein
MRRARLLVGVLLSLAGLAASAVYRRRRERRRERVDLYAEDGSMASITEGTAEAERLLPLARALLSSQPPSPPVPPPAPAGAAPASGD